MASAKRNSPADDTFEEMRKFVHKLVGRFLSVYKLDRNDAVSAAYLGFVQAYHTFDHSVGTAFVTWVGEKVKRRLLDLLRKTINERKGIRTVSLDGIDVADTKQTFDPVEWADTLSKKARMVANLVIDTPIDVKLLLKQLGLESPGNWRTAIREFLEERGWEEAWTKSAFQEIKEAL